MAVKILVNNLGQHIIADVKQVTNKETEELVAYWVREPRQIVYRPAEEGGLIIDMSPTCPVAVTTEHAIRADSIVSILDPVESVEERYMELINPAPSEVAVEELTESPAEVVELEAPAEPAEEA